MFGKCVALFNDLNDECDRALRIVLGDKRANFVELALCRLGDVNAHLGAFLGH